MKPKITMKTYEIGFDVVEADGSEIPNATWNSVAKTQWEGTAYTIMCALCAAEPSPHSSRIRRYSVKCKGRTIFIKDALKATEASHA